MAISDQSEMPLRVTQSSPSLIMLICMRTFISRLTSCHPESVVSGPPANIAVDGNECVQRKPAVHRAALRQGWGEHRDITVGEVA